jgi:hypothetical protein
MNSLRILIVSCFLLLGWMPVQAEIPSLMNYQGTLTDEEGAPLVGSHDLMFRLYPSAEGGSAFWSESHPGVALADGVFSVVLGTVSPLTPAVFVSTECWISVQVDAGTEISPRMRVTSVPYALRAESAEVAANAPLPPVIIWSGGCSHQGVGGGLITYCNDRTDFNTASDYLTANGLGAFRFLRPGYYRITLHVVSIGNGYASIWFWKNGSLIQLGNEYAGTNWTDNFAEVVWPFAVNDVFHAEVNDPGTIAYESWSSGYSRLQIQYVGPLN